jgi:hypothetical protein
MSYMIDPWTREIDKAPEVTIVLIFHRFEIFSQIGCLMIILKVTTMTKVLVETR